MELKLFQKDVVGFVELLKTALQIREKTEVFLKFNFSLIL